MTRKITVSAESYSTDGSAVILHSCYDNKTFDSWQSAYNDVLNNSEFINEFTLPQTELVKESVKFALINIDDSGRPLLALCNSSAYAYGGARLLSYDTETQKIVLINDFMPFGGYYDSSTNSYLMENVVSKDEFLQSINQYGIKKPSCLTDNIEDTGMQILDYNKDMYEITPSNISSVLGIENGNKCGDNATWSFDEATGTLTISGTGDMYDYNNIYGGEVVGTAPFAPWIDFIDSIKRIVIEDGITYISGGFLGCKNANELIIPESVTSVDVMAFRGCLSLKNVTIPKSLTSIGQDAFGLIGEEGIIEGFTISGYAGSAAEQYAKDHNIPFTYLTENGDSNKETDSTDSNNDNSDDKSDGKTVIPSSPETGDNLLAGAGVASVIAGAGLYISAKKKNKK